MTAHWGIVVCCLNWNKGLRAFLQSGSLCHCIVTCTSPADQVFPFPPDAHRTVHHLSSVWDLNLGMQMSTVQIHLFEENFGINFRCDVSFYRIIIITPHTSVYWMQNIGRSNGWPCNVPTVHCIMFSHAISYSVLKYFLFLWGENVHPSLPFLSAAFSLSNF